MMSNIHSSQSRALRYSRLGGLRYIGLLVLALMLASGRPGFGQIVLGNYSNSPFGLLKIMPIGDSITDDCVTNGAWRQYLQPLLEADGYPFTFVGRQASTTVGTFTKTRHEGYCGSVIAAPGMMPTPVHGYQGSNVYLLKITADTLRVSTYYYPDIALVEMGANDIGRGRDPYHVATNDVPALLDLIWSYASNANIILIKASTLSNAAPSAGYNTNAPNVPIYNAALQQLVNARRALGQKVFLADMFSTVDYSTMFESDHLHPNPAGRSAIAAEFFSRIQAITIRSDKVCTDIVPGGAVWKYSDTGRDLGSTWTHTDYDDTAWSEGPARLGYGDPVTATALSYGSPDARNSTIYFRHAFVVPENVAYTNLNIRLADVDGAVVWLNGAELFRRNMPAGALGYTNLASASVTGESAYIYYPTNIAVPPLPPGTNVVAVEVHPSSLTNSSMGFDVEVIGKGYWVPPPSISAAITGQGLTLMWPATNRIAYALYWSTNLAVSGNWSPLLSVPHTNNGQCVMEIPNEGPSRFFRLQKQ